MSCETAESCVTRPNLRHHLFLLVKHSIIKSGFLFQPQFWMASSVLAPCLSSGVFWESVCLPAPIKTRQTNRSSSICIQSFVSSLPLLQTKFSHKISFLSGPRCLLKWWRPEETRELIRPDRGLRFFDKPLRVCFYSFEMVRLVLDYYY